MLARSTETKREGEDKRNQEEKGIQQVTEKVLKHVHILIMFSTGLLNPPCIGSWVPWNIIILKNPKAETTKQESFFVKQAPFPMDDTVTNWVSPMIAIKT